MKLVRFVAIAFFGVLCMYLLQSFYFLTTDPNVWTQEGRALFVIAAASIIVCAAGTSAAV